MSSTSAFPGYMISGTLYERAEKVVYQGRRDADGAKVVLKTFRTDSPTPIDVARLRHEHSIIAELKGPGIVAVDPLVTGGARVALVMEDLGLRPLGTLLGAPLDTELALRISIALTDILQRAHEKRIIHKDIKPHNVLVDTNPLRVYLIDWGSAAWLSEARQSVLLPDEATMDYISPEQIGILDRRVDARSDLYSLGVMLYELLTGRLPFVEADPKELIRRHLTSIPQPPHQVNQAVPAHLSDLVMKLLKKSPEERYRSASGLQSDLSECLRQWEQTGKIEPFPLGRLDRLLEFRVPDKIYGREETVAEVLSAFARARRGSAELVLLAGYAGVGKSAVVREARRSMELSCGRVIARKFEQFRDAAPYALLAQVLQDLLRSRMADRSVPPFRWRERLQSALQQEADVLVQLVPELDSVLGPQPAAPKLDPAAAETRLHFVAQRFISAFASQEHPVVFFLDDLQWADPASLRLLESLLADPESRYLLIIGAYRDHDSSAIQFLTRTLDKIADAGGLISQIYLQPLSPQHVDRLIADALDTTVERVAPLGSEVFAKTRGNPFFIGQLLSSLVQDGAISFDAVQGEWGWDLHAIAAWPISDSVADFVAQRIRRLGEAPQQLLQLAACLGAQFEHDVLAELAGQSTSECARRLWDALTEGLILPLHDDYRLLQQVVDARKTPESEGASSGPAPSSRVTYRFAHDRVQEAAYSLLDREERASAHAKIARLLLSRCGGDVSDADLFTVVDHLNSGQAFLKAPAERLEAAALNLRAERRATASVAYAKARTYAAEGRAFLGENAWEQHYDLCFTISSEQAQLAYLCGDFGEADALFDELLARARSPTLEVEVHKLRIDRYLAVSPADALRVARLALSTLGAPLPEAEEACRAALDEEMKQVLERLRQHPLEELAGAPPMSELRLKQISKLLILIDPISAIFSQKLSALVSVRQVALSLEHGPSELSAFGYMAFAQMLMRMFGMRAEAEQLIRLSLAISDRYPNAEYDAKVSYLHAGTAAFFKPIRETVACYEHAVQVGLQCADANSTAVAVVVGMTLRLTVADDELRSLTTLFRLARATAQRIRVEWASMILQLGAQVIACLKGETQGPLSLDDHQFDEGALLARAREKRFDYVLSYQWYFKVFLCCVDGDYGADSASLLKDVASRSQYMTRLLKAQSSFFVCLCLCGMLKSASEIDAPRYRSMLDEHHREIVERRRLLDELWSAPDLLIQAERAHLDGRDDEAQRLYVQALDLAQQHPFLFALGSEMCGRFNLRRGYSRIAKAYLNDAHEGWLRWGASAKADRLAAQFRGYITQPEPRASTSSRFTRATSSTIVLESVLGDLEEAMRAAHAISSEIIVERVVEQFLMASSVSSGARRVLVILVRDGQLKIVGRVVSDQEPRFVKLDLPFGEAVDLAGSVVRRVAHTRETVFLSNDSADAFAEEDPYLRKHRPQFLLCIPLLYQGSLVGVWYADSNVGAGLRKGSISLLQMLAGQAASALENARLYEQLQATSSALSRANEFLESEVAKRTAELREAHQLLVKELEERGAIERERAALQERMIQMQEEALQELSNPLLFIDDGILVMPLIGTMDERRSSRLWDTVLAGVHERRARVLIIDVTGLRGVDTATAQILSRLAGALRLLGTQVILCGVRPHVSKTFIELGVNLKNEIKISANLKGGIMLAMRGK